MAKSKPTAPATSAAPLPVIVTRKVDTITPYERNARIIPQSGIELVAKSIKQFGFKQPIVVDAEGVIIAGHTRLLAAKHLGLTSVPVIVATDLTPEQVRAYRLMDNRSNQESTWDQDVLREELGDLSKLFKDDKAILSDMTGFGDKELDAFIGSLSTTAPDLAPKDGKGGKSSRLEDEEDDDKCSCPRCGFKFAPRQVTRVVKKARKLFGEVEE